MAWFTPVFFVAPPPPPTPAPVYRTYVPAPPAYHGRVVAVLSQAGRPVATPVKMATAAAAPPKPEAIPAGAPAALRSTVYLSRHRQRTAQSILTVIAAQIGYRVDFRASETIPAPKNAGLVWMSSPQQGASAFQQLARLGAALHRLHQGSIQINPNTRKITLLPPESH